MLATYDMPVKRVVRWPSNSMSFKTDYLVPIRTSERGPDMWISLTDMWRFGKLFINQRPKRVREPLLTSNAWNLCTLLINDYEVVGKPVARNFWAPRCIFQDLIVLRTV